MVDSVLIEFKPRIIDFGLVRGLPGEESLSMSSKSSFVVLMGRGVYSCLKELVN